jgi:hypothetical protein
MLHKGILKFDNNYAILDENNRADMMSFRKQKKLMILRYLAIIIECMWKSYLLIICK